MNGLAKSIHVLLSDSRPLVLKGLDCVINDQKPQMEVVGQSSSYNHTLHLASQLQPDVVLISFYFDVLDPWVVLPALKRIAAIQVLLLLDQQSSFPLDRASEAGANGFVFLEHPTDSIAQAITQAMTQTVSSTQLNKSNPYSSPLLAKPAEQDVNCNRDKEIQTQLTQRERELIRTIATHPADKYISIAQRLAISEHTVHNHLSNIYRKLKLINRIDLLVYSLKHGLNERRVKARAVTTSLQAFAARY